ncbi:MAG: hypothetical protein C7B47_10660 [Sulfobacillus thermosulfidooxidans]|uniref:Uncharacterized protein n=1 Tax=Sulfobacillus thermosulfidooxidans TaxID=28034 RepID=A0A2T2WW75_SULTH|nr:MAG: hypothetical protein C7B47_10660 [Sulfobacillus thermosulfidooxidans]
MILFAFNPAAVFYSTLYPEAFIVLFWLASILVAIKKTYYRASLSAGLAALSHPTGALLGIVPLFLLIQSFFYQFFHPKDQKNLNDQNNGDRKGYLVWGLGIAGGLGAFMLYSLFHWHTLFAPWTGEQRWHSQWIWPWQQYTLLLTTKYSLTQFIFWSVVSVPFLLGAGMLHRLHFPMKPAIILFTWINLLISLSFYANQDPFHSTIRLISVDFPTYAGLAALPKSLYIKIIMIIWTGYMIYGTILFTHQWWWQ